jgi:hypothetical protein
MTAISSTNSVSHEWTSTCMGNEVRNGRCTTCREPASGSWRISPMVRVSGNVGDVVRVSVEGVVDVEEILSEPAPPWHQARARYTPRVKSVVPVWEQRQMLRQQRPRDGLK